MYYLNVFLIILIMDYKFFFTQQIDLLFHFCFNSKFYKVQKKDINKLSIRDHYS